MKTHQSGVHVNITIGGLDLPSDLFERIQKAQKFHGISLDELLQAALRNHLLHLENLKKETERQELEDIKELLARSGDDDCPQVHMHDGAQK